MLSLPQCRSLRLSKQRSSAILGTYYLLFL
jgi:hypothetical protein